MKIVPIAAVDGAYEITLKPIDDPRGYFMRTYDRDIFAENGLQTEWRQENQSANRGAGILRGLHFQAPPHAETKLVRALSGSVQDVFVDIRRSSPTFGGVGIVELSADRHNAVYIPRGCAHAYLTLSDETVVAYKVDHPYAPQAEGGLIWNDPALVIPWALDGEPTLSDKDRRWPVLADLVSPFD